MPRFLLQHRHEPDECEVVFAAFKGHDSPLRHSVAIASCLNGGHSIWWTVEATSDVAAMDLLPAFVATRTTAVPVREVVIP
jgi:hypothetical protein